MSPVQAPSLYTGGANVIAVLILLAEFGMLRQALVRDQVRLYAAQSGLISVLTVIVGAVQDLPELYLLAALSAALKVVVIPLVLRRLLRGRRGLLYRDWLRQPNPPGAGNCSAHPVGSSATGHGRTCHRP
jgi:hypothetical protein